MWGLVILVVCLLPVLLLDAALKWRRLRGRPSVSDELFLARLRRCDAPWQPSVDLDEEVLRLRRLIAKELGLPVLKIVPEDDLLELRDRYCNATSGTLALGDLLDDLASDGSEAHPETVEELIRERIRCPEPPAVRASRKR
jgi:hypothetical protein